MFALKVTTHHSSEQAGNSGPVPVAESLPWMLAEKDG
jgi:hypothetical protein